MTLEKPRRENDSRASWLGMPSFSLDMKIILVWTALGIISIYTPIINQSFFRLILSLPIILFIPGYVLIAALFPSSKDIDITERLVFSIAGSILLTPLIGLCLNFSPWGIRLDPLLFSITGVVVILVIIAGIRRSQIPSESRYEYPVLEIHQIMQQEWALRNGSKKERILLFASIFAIGMVILSAVFVVTMPKPGEKFTEFFILGENQTVDSYPLAINPEKTYPMYIGIVNHEFRTVNYSVEVYLVSKKGNDTLNEQSISSELHVKTVSVTLRHNETSVIPFSLMVPDANYNRVDFLLFDENGPSSEISGSSRVNASYRNLHLWFNNSAIQATNSSYQKKITD